MIRPATAKDCPQIADIYNYYIAESAATFEETPVSAQQMNDRLTAVTDAGYAWLVSETDDEKDKITGYAYAQRWKGRSAYRFSAEVTVYLANGHSGRGTGTLLYEQLFSQLKDMGCRNLIAGISLPNPDSIALHEKFGMTQVALFPRIGYKFNRWIDVGYWQVQL